MTRKKIKVLAFKTGRRTWKIKPTTRIKESGKRYDRKKLKRTNQEG